MKKIILGVIGVFILIIFVRAMINVGREAKLPVSEQKQEVQKAEQKTEAETVEIAEKPTQSAVLSGEDPETGDVILEINVWEEAGSGGPENVAIGSVSHNTEVEVTESKEVDGFVFYKIRSSVGNVSVLPTDFKARAKAMDERPEEEWSVPADPSFPVEGWVSEVFITDLE